MDAFEQWTALGAGERKKSVSEVVMSSTGNFNPEWGYLAPRPGMIRSFRMALLAGAIGTVAGMAVAVAFIAHPAVDLSVAARTMAQLGESDDLPDDLPKSAAATPASAEVFEVKTPGVAAPQMSSRPVTDPRNEKNFAAAESHSAATDQHPAVLAGLAEAPSVADYPAGVPSGMTPAPEPRKTGRAPQAATVAALTEAPTLRDDASAEMSAKAVSAPSSKMTNKRVQAPRVRTARADFNPHERDNGGPFGFFRTILGGNPLFNDQIR
jgi:hypothetical protein